MSERKWQFKTKFRARAYGWRGSRLAISRLTAKADLSDEYVDNPDYDDSRYNEYPIGNLNARYRCFPAKPFHDFPPR